MSKLESEKKQQAANLKAKDREIFALKEKHMALEKSMKKSETTRKQQMQLVQKVRRGTPLRFQPLSAF